jgi:hypothetical protein
MTLLMVMTVCLLVYAALLLWPVSLQGCGRGFRVLLCGTHSWNESVPVRQVDGALVMRG